MSENDLFYMEKFTLENDVNISCATENFFARGNVFKIIGKNLYTNLGKSNFLQYEDKCL